MKSMIVWTAAVVLCAALLAPLKAKNDNVVKVGQIRFADEPVTMVYINGDQLFAGSDGENSHLRIMTIDDEAPDRPIPRNSLPIASAQ